MYITLGYFLFSIYIVSLIFFIIGILKIPREQTLTPSSGNISIIVCVRDGELSIYNILYDLNAETFTTTTLTCGIRILEFEDLVQTFINKINFCSLDQSHAFRINND